MKINGRSHEEIKKKIEALIRSAENGDINSMRCIAYAYASGQYLPKDFFAAEAWYSKAAELGSKRAKKELAQLLMFGNGVAQDWIEAFKIYQKLWSKFDLDGIAGVGIAYKLGRGVAKDEKKGSQYLQQAFYTRLELYKLKNIDEYLDSLPSRDISTPDMGVK